MGKIKVKIDSWDKISINIYKDILEITKNEALSETEKNIALIALFCEVDESEIWGLTVPEVQSLRGQVSWIEDIGDFSDNKVKFKKINIGAYECVINTDTSKMTLAQYVDFQANWNKNGDIDSLASIIACFAVPKGYKYNDGYDVADLINSINEYMSYKTATQLYFFLHRSLVSSTRDTLIYLDKDLKKMMKKKSMKLMGEKIATARKEIQHLISTIGSL